MGYTHYWRIKERQLDPERFKLFSADCEKLCRASEVPLGNWEGKESPEFTDDHVSFNGRAPENDHESFVVKLQNETFEFCKTAYKPYDICVVACLIALDHHFHDSIESISSDGDNSGWAAGRHLCQAVLGYGEDFRLPGEEEEEQ